MLIENNSSFSATTVYSRVSPYEEKLRLISILEMVEMDKDQSGAQHAASHAATNDAIDFWNAARRDEGNAHAAANAMGVALSEEQAKPLADRTARAKRAKEQTQAISKDKARVSSNSRALYDRLFGYVATVDLSLCTRVSPPKFKGDLGPELEKALAVQEGERWRIEEIQGLPMSKAALQEKAIANLETIPRDPMPDVGPNGEIDFRQRHAIPAEALGNRQPFAWDARQFYLSDPSNFETVKRHVLKVIEQRYADVRETATESEKRKMVAACEGHILAAERKEIAILFAMRERGQQVSFRADTDPRALLGIDGPAPKKRR